MVNLANNSINKVGGKAYSLMQLEKINMNVPRFFVVTTDMFYDFIKTNNLEQSIKLLYKKNRLEDIQKLIISGNFSDEMTTFIYSEFDKLQTNKVSVRSSAVIEDSKIQSCAGQFNTFLNVTKKNLLEMIKNCFASLYTQTVKSYINSFSQINKGIAVVIQTMIHSKYSGVAFSTDYNLDNKDYMIVEAVKGLGEGLVSGQITPSKYFVRKSNLSLDKIVNEKFKIKDYIINIAKNANLIEKAYQMPMDIEWAIDENGKLFILQARPIVSFNKERVYQYTFSRPRPLFEADLQYLIYTKGLMSVSNNLFYFDPIWIYNTKVYKEYSNITNINEDPFVLVRYAIANNLLTEKHVNLALKSCKYVNNHILDKKIDINSIIKNYLSYEAYNLISNFFINDNTLHKINIDGLNKNVYDTLLSNRDYFDSTNEKVLNLIKTIAKSYLDDEYEQQYKFLRLEEILNKVKLNKSKIEKRKKGFILYQNILSFETNEKNIQAWARKQSIILNDAKSSNESTESVKGEVAFHGNVTGIAKVIYNEDDFSKVEKGDIVISPMTVPSFIPILKKASAIITDDGGTVCHAALIARELKFPCLVGTKNATQIFKDGDIVNINTALSCATKKSAE